MSPVPATQESDDSDWVEFGGSNAVAESSLAPSLCCVFTTNLCTSSYPEILAVDCEAADRESVEKCMTYLANFMYNSKMVVPHKMRFTLQMEDESSTKYFSVLQVTNPAQVETLYEKYLGGLPLTTPEKVLLLMPIVPNADGSASWGQLSSAPENKRLLRDNIKAILEDQEVSPCGLVRVLGSGSGPKKGRKKRKVQAQGKVKLGDALAHPEWKIQWDPDLKDEDIQYMKKHSKHFLALKIDGISARRAKKYIGAVCNSGDHWPKWYKEGKMIESAAIGLKGAN